MKNLLIYVNPDGFDAESEKLTKIQIDNSLELGWNPADVILITDFPYEYRGIKATVVSKGSIRIKTYSKLTTIVHLFKIGFIGDDLYWCHDIDAYQLEPITEKELGLDKLDAGFNDYGRKPLWQLGSFFFKKGARDIFSYLVERINIRLPQYGKPHKNKNALDEMVLLEMTDNNVNNINRRIKRLNGTYDFGMRKIPECYEKTIKPLKVLHFHPESKLQDTLGIVMHGRNRLGFPLMNERLIKIFNHYGYT